MNILKLNMEYVAFILKVMAFVNWKEVILFISKAERKEFLCVGVCLSLCPLSLNFLHDIPSLILQFQKIFLLPFN